MTATLRVSGLQKRFGGITAIASLDISLTSGRITGLVGPNGAGKTTAFNLLTGFLPRDRARHAAPQVRLPRRVERDAELVVHRALLAETGTAGRSVTRAGSRARRRCRSADRREIRRPRLADRLIRALSQHEPIMSHLLSANMGTASFWPGWRQAWRLATALAR